MEPRRRVVAGLGGAAAVLIGIGVAAIVFDAGFGGGLPSIGTATTTLPTPSSNSLSGSPSAPISTHPGTGIPGTVPPSASASAPASSGPSQRTIGFMQQGNGFIYLAADGSVVPVPAVSGLEIVIDKGRALYYALASNKYGLLTNSYAGEFIPLVTMGQADGSSAETGGLALAGPVVAKLISDKLATITSDSDRWIVALPVDIRSSGKAIIDVSFDQFGLAGWSDTPRVVVRFAGSLPVVEANPTNGGFHVLVEGLGVTAWQVIDPVRLGLPTDAIDPAHSMNELLVYGSGTPTLDGSPVVRDINADGRAAMGQLMIAASGDVSVSLVVAGSHADLGPDKILTVGNVPVFVAQA
jgi:hypothetical protein